MKQETPPLLALLAGLGIDRVALFLDVDGTLAPIASRPQDVRLAPQTVQTLRTLHAHSNGAVALVSGRAIADLDRLAAPLALPAAGAHGAQWRAADGTIKQVASDPAVMQEIIQALEPMLRTHPGLQLENKGLSLALHYRHAPHCRALVEQTLAELVARHAQTHALQAGKCVLEVVPRGVSKGAAIGRYMQSPPFWGRVPVFVGDDVTDESGFKMVNQVDGVSVKVGEGETLARHRIASVDALLHVLARWCADLQRTALGGAPDDSMQRCIHE
ncbi:trehalose-phosphatase [Orrella sp. JC864]|uniref:trehalose-phosphatase n=1 Tax=Orrella sp. JC864 TaxID=3120298 RepID=UPI0012BD4C8B